MKPRHLTIAICAATVQLLACTSERTSTASNKTERIQLAHAIDSSIRYESLDKWYPRAVDSLYGGFLSTFSFDFTPQDDQDKMIVTQARHVWSNAVAAELYPGNAVYMTAAKQGFNFLRSKMWDSLRGGFYTLVDRQGRLKDSSGKFTYGNAFGIYAAAAWYRVSRDSNALNLAKTCFMWLEQHAHDPVHKGYFQHLGLDGSPKKRTATTLSTSDLGYKDQNTSIHLLEAFSELYMVWPDELLKQRLQEMLVLVRDVITDKQGSLVLFFQPDWTPVSFRDSTRESILKHRFLDHVSFGHDVETAYLLIEASHALGLKNDTTTMKMAKGMVDHSLRNGWDTVNGGFYDEGYYFSGSDTISIIRDSKNWWGQAEGLNTLLLMADLYPDDPVDYYGKFRKQWNYIHTYLIDHQYGDWYSEGLDTRPGARNGLKGHVWKAAYHQLRGLSNVVKRLRDE